MKKFFKFLLWIFLIVELFCLLPFWVFMAVIVSVIDIKIEDIKIGKPEEKPAENP